VPAKVKKPARSGAVEGMAGERVEFEASVVVLGKVGDTTTGVADGGVLRFCQYFSLVRTADFVLTLLKYHYRHPRRRYHHHD
jgi:hypothetical protein